ncbi:unnamed protein product [Caenorhabditis nigoni]
MLVLIETGESNGTIILFENLIGRPIVFMYIVNPVVTVNFITPYRNVVLKWFRSIFPCFPETPVLIVPSRSATGTS